MTSNFELSTKDAIYVTSWAAYNDGNSLSNGGWFMLDDLAALSNEEIFDEFRKVGLDPTGYDEELVVHDFDDYSGVGYYELFGEPYPLTVVELYRDLQALDNDELAVFIAIKELRSADEALAMLRGNELGDFGIMDEASFDSMLQEDVESMMGNPKFLEHFQIYIDREALKRDLEFDIEYDEETGEPEYEIDDYFLDEVIETASMEFLERYFDFDEYKRDVLMDGFYEEFDLEGETYYLYEY